MFSWASARNVANPKKLGAKAMHMPARQSRTMRPGTVRMAKAKNVKPWCNIQVTFSLPVWPLFAAESYFGGLNQCRIKDRVKQMNRDISGCFYIDESGGKNCAFHSGFAHFACKHVTFSADVSLSRLWNFNARLQIGSLPENGAGTSPFAMRMDRPHPCQFLVSPIPFAANLWKKW